jgi:hypothetical protein
VESQININNRNNLLRDIIAEEAVYKEKEVESIGERNLW